MIDLAARLDRQSVVTAFVLVALLLCAIFMPAMAMAALVGCGVAVMVLAARAGIVAPIIVRTSAPVLLPAAAPTTMGTGPPVPVPLRT